MQRLGVDARKTDNTNRLFGMNQGNYFPMFLWEGKEMKQGPPHISQQLSQLLSRSHRENIQREKLALDWGSLTDLQPLIMQTEMFSKQ